MPQWRSTVMTLAPASARAPFVMPSFREHYRVVRRVLGVVVILVTLGTGFTWNVDAARIVLPAVAGLGATTLLHDLLLPRVSWRSMAIFDAIAYIGMLVLIELPEPIAFVVMSQVLITFLTVPPRTALRTTAFLLALGWAGYAGITYLDVQIYRPGERLFLSVLASMMAMVPSCWAMLIAGAEMRTQRSRVRQLLTEKDELIADKDRFLATVSHELRTPLTVVHGLAIMLESVDLDEAERRDLMRAMAQESGDVAAIVEDLLVLARLDGGTLSVRPQPLEIRSLVEQVGQTRGLDARVPDLEATVVADPIRVRQVVRNLLVNAQRYGGSHVRIEISADSGEVTVAVCDDGPGVPIGTEDLIFEPYGRAHAHPDQVDSVGLGLSVSRELARMMGGDVVYQRQQDWTRFELTLPAHDPVSSPTP